MCLTIRINNYLVLTRTPSKLKIVPMINEKLIPTILCVSFNKSTYLQKNNDFNELHSFIIYIIFSDFSRKIDRKIERVRTHAYSITS